MRPFRLAPARPARQLVTRPRLLALLGERFERRLVLVVAGAGFGKSTLLAQAVAENQLDPRGVDVWLSCAQDDAAASQLAAGLLTALHADPAGAGDPGAAIAAAVWQRAPAEVALLLDDVHLLPTGSPGAALLAELPRALPANAHLVLAGRADPPVGWSRLAAAGEVREIREENLGFAAPEVAEFARLRDVPPALLAGVGGWPALAELTAATGQSRVADFLWEEILSAVPGPDRRLLAAIAAAGGADDEVASALAGRPVALTSLLAGLPLIAKGDGGWHRLHALWQPALIRELSPAEVADVRRTAGRVLHERGDMPAAARLYADAAAWDDLDRLIVDTCQITYPVVGNDVLGEWLRRLPPARRGEPTAVLLEGTLLRAVDPPAGQALLRRAAAGYRAADQLAGVIACLSRLAWIAWWQRDPEAIGNLQPRVVELASSSRVTGPAGDSLAALSAWAQLVGADVSGNTAGALALLESMTATRFSPDWQAVFDVYRGLQHLALGDPATALVFAERAVANAAVTAQQGNLSLALSCLQLMGRLDEVVARLPDMFAVPELVAQNRVAQNALAAVWLAWVGRPVQARKHLREAEQAGRGLSTPMTPVFLAAGRLAVALAEGDEAAGALAARLHRLCEGEPSMARLVDRAFLAVQYVLLPSTRTWWDAQPLAGCFAAARDLARTVVALRDGARPDRSRLPAPEVIRAFLPSTWVSELAAAGGSPAELVAAAGTGPPDALGAPVHIHLLGPVQLFRDGIPVTHPHLRRGRVRELLAYLVVHRGATRRSVAADLWPDLDEAAAAGNLRVTLTYLAQLLDEPDRPRTEPSRLLRRTESRVELIESPLLTTDVWMVDRFLDEAGHAEQQRAPSVALARYRQAVQTYPGVLLADEPGPEWLLPYRDRLQHRFVAAAVRAGELLLASGTADEPLRLAQRAVAADGWSEPAHQLLVSAHLAAGNVTAARLALDDCHRMLRALGTPPDARTLMLTRRLTGGIAHRQTPPTGRPTRPMPAPRSATSAPR